MIPGSTRDDGTFRWGEHARVVKRPPRTDGFGGSNTDPRRNDDVERWECTECGFTAQAARGLGPVFSTRRCPPREGDHADVGDTPPACDPTRLDDDLEDLARRLATETDVSAAEVAGHVRKLDEFSVPPEEIERSLRLRFDDGGEA
jgi:hypothetical protein